MRSPFRIGRWQVDPALGTVSAGRTVEHLEPEVMDVLAFLPRPRLFRQLDSTRRSRVLWLSAAAGSGKTALAASYLGARRRPCVWYQMDGRDADPAAFFYYLREAAAPFARGGDEALPLLTPEYALGLDAYARHFFELLGGRLPSDAWLVLDDYQDAPESAPIHALLPQRGTDTPEQQVLFDYFAAEIFDHMPAAAQRLLLASAILPEVDAAAAEALSGEPRSSEILADLVRRNYFT